MKEANKRSDKILGIALLLKVSKKSMNVYI